MNKQVVMAVPSNRDYSDFPPAPLSKRVFAFLLDASVLSIVLTAVFVVFFGIYFFVFLRNVLSMADLEILRQKIEQGVPILDPMAASAGLGLKEVLGFLVFFLLVVLVSAALWHLYFIFFENRDQATPGKKAFGLKVISLQSEKPTYGQVVWREIFRSYIDLPLMIPGIVMMILTPENERLGDRFSKTRVVDGRAALGPEPFDPAIDKPAGLGIRLVAITVDKMLVGLLAFPLTLVAFFSQVFASTIGQPAYGSLLRLSNMANFLLSLGIYIIYAGYFYRHYSATPGKMLFGMRVFKGRDHRNLSYFDACARDLVGRLLSLLFLGAGLIMVLLRRDKRALHDLLVKSQVVRRG